jgi:DNA-binding PadR family transcriptional regulator
MKRERIRGHLDSLLLSVLNAGPAHGYEVVSELRRRSAGEFDLPEGTVYPALYRLEAQGLLASDWDTGSGRRRRTYRITAAGRAALRDATAEWRRFAAGVDALLGSA